MAHPAVKDFVRALGEIDRSKRETEVFADFCEMAYCALAKQASPYSEQREALEAQYMQVVGRYRDKNDVRKMPALMGLALSTIAGGGVDFMGQVAAEIGALDEGLGQFFTPYEVSRLMAEMNLGDATAAVAAKGFLTLCEPAAGAGGMMLAAADTLDRQGVDLCHVWMEGTELSRSTYHMLYVQVAARGIAGRMICGNSLSGEIYAQAFTPAAGEFVARHGHPFASQIAAEQAEAHAVEKKAALIAMLEQQHLAAAE